jgi:GMP synthase-like glutamine amidotransferase
MKPVLILQNANNDGPDYFEDYLVHQSVPYQIVNAAQGQALPQTMAMHSGFALMGGPMGANDEAEFAHLTQAYVLLDQALAQGIPVIGHCLGGQMLARALGGTVSKARTLEVGWHPVTPMKSARTEEWLGDNTFYTMQWHYDEFSLAPGAQLLASSPYAPHQAFVAEGKFLGMQFHIEARAAKIDTWLDEVRSPASLPNGLNCHDDVRIKSDSKALAAQAKHLADRIYARWLQCLIEGA